MKNEHGFSLLEILIVVAVIGIVATISIPALTRSRVNANESATKSNLQTFANTAESYRSAQTPLTYPASLGDLTTATPSYLDSTWGTGTTLSKNGYNLTYVRASESRYAFYAEPSESGTTGNNSYCVDETAQVWTSTTSSGAFAGSPCASGAGAMTIS